MVGLMRLVPGGVIVPTALADAVLVDAAFETAIIFCTTIGALVCDVVSSRVGSVLVSNLLRTSSVLVGGRVVVRIHSGTISEPVAVRVFVRICVCGCDWNIKSPAFMLQICFFSGTVCCCSVGAIRLVPAGTTDALRIIVLLKLTLMFCGDCVCCVCSNDIRGICALVNAGSVVFMMHGDGLH